MEYSSDLSNDPREEFYREDAKDAKLREVELVFLRATSLISPQILFFRQDFCAAMRNSSDIQFFYFAKLRALRAFAVVFFGCGRRLRCASFASSR